MKRKVMLKSLDSEQSTDKGTWFSMSDIIHSQISGSSSLQGKKSFGKKL